MGRSAGEGAAPVAAATRVLLVIDDREVLLGRLDPRRPPDLGVVDGLARLQVAARRRGWRVRLRHPPGRRCPVTGLLDLVGLGEVVPGGDEAERRQVVAEAARLLQPQGQADGGELVGPEEVVEPGDPPV